MMLVKTSVMASAFKLLLLITVTSVFSFMPISTTSNSATILFSSKPQTYAELLQASKLAKQKAGSPAPRQAAPVAPVPRSVPVPVESKAKAAPQQLPFDDVMYDHLKFVIGKLSARMKSDTPLTAEELTAFKNSCFEIIKDAKSISGDVAAVSAPVAKPVAKPVARAVPAAVSDDDDEVIDTPEPITFTNVASRRDGSDTVHKALPIKKATKKEETFVIYEAGDGPRADDVPDPNSPYSDLHGLSNTWQMPGMDNMTTDEYYAAINKRILDMKNKRKLVEGDSTTMVSDYLDSLSKPRK